MNEEQLNNVLKGIDFGEDYVLVYKDFESVLNDIVFANDDEKLLTHAIIKNLEVEASKQFLKDMAVDIPHIGVAQRNLLRKEVISSYKELKEARNSLPEEQYQEFKFNLLNEKKAKINAIELKRKIAKDNRNKHYKLWVKLSRKYGINYANFYIKMTKAIQVIEYNEELNNAYIDAWS